MILLSCMLIIGVIFGSESEPIMGFDSQILTVANSDLERVPRGGFRRGVSDY